MASNVTVDSITSRIRSRSDNETATPSDHIVSDVDIVVYQNEAYKQIWDALVEMSGYEYFGKEAALASPYALPADFYQLRAVDFGASPNVLSLKPWSFGERNNLFDDSYPRYRLRGGNIVFKPATFTASVTIHYVSTAPTLVAGGTFDGYNGWEEYMVAWGVSRAQQKQEYDPSIAMGEAQNVMTRIKRMALHTQDERSGIADVTSMPDDFYLG